MEWNGMSGELLQEFARVRKESVDICAPLEVEDYGLQAMDDVSPPKWHLAHTSWFFERFILRENPSYACFDEQFDLLFNSYYESVGPFHPRPKRGFLSRPTLQSVLAYRQHVDQKIFEHFQHEGREAHLAILELGLEHEKQHQELLWTDILYNFYVQPSGPALTPYPHRKKAQASSFHFRPIKEGLYTIGWDKPSFAFDNERPAHKVYIGPVALASRLVSNGEYMDFILSGGYQDVRLWLSEGWLWLQKQNLRAPLYWRKEGGEYEEFGFQGWTQLDPHASVTHLSYYEADAYARWRDCRLPREEEWEVFAHQTEEAYADHWQWTQSSYAPYPGFRSLPGSLGEYNGKFMVNQYVLRGGSLVTAAKHLRPTYRNFFPASAQWQFTGIRLAKEL